MNRCSTLVGALVIVLGVVALLPVPAVAQTDGAEMWTLPRTPWGDPDLQGI